MTTNIITVRAIVSADKQKTRKASPREQLKPIFPREFFSYFETYRTLSLNKEIPFPFPFPTNIENPLTLFKWRGIMGEVGESAHPDTSGGDRG